MRGGKQTFAALCFTVFAGCKTTMQEPATLRQLTPDDFTSVTIPFKTSKPTENAEEESSIRTKPFEFWMHKDQNDDPGILVVNRTNKDLIYLATNEGIQIPVSPPAVQCMEQIVKKIEGSGIETSPTWNNYQRKFPYRFLAILPELHDFYSAKAPHPAQSVSPGPYYRWVRPVLWNGMSAADAPQPGSENFTARGYIKWTGVLLPDGITCIIARPQNIEHLLTQAMRCEADQLSACNFATAAH